MGPLAFATAFLLLRKSGWRTLDFVIRFTAISHDSYLFPQQVAVKDKPYGSVLRTGRLRDVVLVTLLHVTGSFATRSRRALVT